jgi:Tfp pilus assembly protein PilF
MPDARWAVKSFQKVLSFDPNDEGALEKLAELSLETQDYKTALAACERLIKRAPESPAVIPHWHRVARIYLQGFNNRQRAEQAYRRALDLDPTSDGALGALIGFYRDANDLRSVRVHLDRVAASMRTRLDQSAYDLVPFRVLARALEARDHAVPGSLAAARCAAEMAQMLGSTDDHTTQLAAQALARPPRATALAATGDKGLEFDNRLYPRVVSSELRQLFVQLGERLAKHVGTDLRRWGVSRNERLRPDDPAARAVAEVAHEMGAGEVEVYVSQRQPRLLVAEPTSPTAIVIGAELAVAATPAAMRFVAGRCLKLARTWLAVPARMSQDELGVLLVGLLRQFAPEFQGRVDPAAAAQEAQRLRRLIPSGQLQELRPYAVALAGLDFDHRKTWLGIQAAGNHAGLLAAGSLGAALPLVAMAQGHPDLRTAAQDPLVVDLIRFAVSDDHAELRGMMGS